ncbi:MAG TPA: AAA family ATPase [Trebonia sp.]
MPEAVTTTASAGQGVRVQLLGQFAVSAGGRVAGPWPRPSARRLCELLLVSPGRRVRRDIACEELFGDRDQRAAARALSKALSMARVALGELGDPGSSLLAADLTHIWIAGHVEVDAEVQDEALRAALAMPPGPRRAGRLRAGLASDAELLADEPDAEWARSPREGLAALRQEARLALARDLGSRPDPVSSDDLAAAWQSCLDHDPACEEAAGALARIYVAQHRPEQAARVLQRCRTALEELGLRLSPSLESVYAAAATEPLPAVRSPAPREERRPVTVLFAEVAASPGATGGRDLEALREAVGGVLAAVMTEVETLGGTITSVSGRGLQALFGVPAAHEDDPERAVRAAYRAVSATSSRTTAGDARATNGVAALRIGIESGPAVVGPVTHGGRAEYTAFGDLVSVAAALQSAARPGSVLVGPATRAASDHLFAWGATEKVALDLGAEPVPASYLDAPRARSGHRRPPLGGTAPLAGREAEMRALAAALRGLATGRGSVVALTGEPGLGKTRLVQEARTRFVTWVGAGTGRLPLWLEGRCASYASATPYGLYRQLLASWTGVSPDQPAALRWSALQRTLAGLMGNANLLPPLARMTSLPTAGHREAGLPERPAGPAETQRMIFDAMHSMVTRLTAVAPTVLVLEDLHWADPTSLHLTRHLAELTRGRPLLLLVTARPEAAAHVTAITEGVCQIQLRPLPALAARELARSLIGEAGEDVLDAVVSSAGGNPLFLEERLAALLETRTLVREQGTWWLRDTADPQLSQVLERLVRSRIDRLSPAAQEAVRAASVLGFEFRPALLSAMLDGEPRRALGSVLDELYASDLIHHRQPCGPEPAFVFRHALIQEAAYLGLLRAERRALHARAAAAIEAAVTEGAVPGVAAVIGRHYASAGDAERAVRFLELAGDHATDAFANDEAISSFRAALAITDQRGTADAVIRLHAKLANVLWRIGRRAETKEAFQDALRVAAADTTVSDLRRAHLHTRIGRLELMDSRFAAAAAAFDAAEALLGANPGDEPGGQDDETVDQWLELMIDGRADMHLLLGESDLAEAVLEKAEPLLETRGNPARKAVFHRLVAMQRMARNGNRSDDTDIKRLRRSLGFARQTGEEKDAAYSLHFLTWALGLHGDLAEARTTAEAAVDTAERIGESYLLPGALTTLALIALHQHDTQTAESALARALAIAKGSVASENSVQGVLMAEGLACQALLAFLHAPPTGRPGSTAALAEELARVASTVQGTARKHLEPVLSLSRGLSLP